MPGSLVGAPIAAVQLGTIFSYLLVVSSYNEEAIPVNMQNAIRCHPIQTLNQNDIWKRFSHKYIHACGNVDCVQAKILGKYFVL